MVSTTVQTILDNLTSLDNWTLPLAVENLTLSLVNASFVPKINGFDDGPQFPAYIRTPSMVLCSIILCIGVLGNIMVPCVILKSKDMRNSTNIFLMNLSIADLMVLLVCTPTVLVEVNSKPETWQMGEHMCKAVPFVELTVAHASVLTILAISFERYYAICEPLKAGYVCTKTRAIVICLLAWGFAALFTSPITWMTEYKHAQYFDNSIVPVCLTQAEKMWPATYFVLIILVFFILPLILLIVLYAIIAKNLMAEINNTNDNNIYNQRARRQVVTMLALVVLSFFLCLLPFRIITLWIVIIPDDNVYSIKKLKLITYYKVLFISRILLYLNSAINPILYNIMSSKFRKGFKKLIGMRNTNHRKFTYTGTLTTTMNSSNQSSTRRLLMTQKSTPNFYNDDSNSFKNKNLYRQSTDSMLFDKRNKNLQMLKNSGSFQTKSKDFDELLNKTCRQCGTTLEEFCKHCRKIVNKSLLEQHTKAKKVCHCEQNIEKNDKNNYLYCKDCEIFVNNRINKAKHSLDASLSTCSRLPINILIQTFESFDNSPVLLKKFNDEKQKEKLRLEMDKIADDESKDAQLPLLNRHVMEGENKSSESVALNRDYDNLTDIEEENNRANLEKQNHKNCLEPKIFDHITLNSDRANLRNMECMKLEEFSIQPAEKTTYDVPKIPVSEADKKRDKFSSILKKSNRKLVTKKSNVSFDLENLNKIVDSGSIEDKNKSENLHDRGDPDISDSILNNQGRFSITRTSVYDNVDIPYDNHSIVAIENTTNDANNSISIPETNFSQDNSHIGINSNKNCKMMGHINQMSCFDYGSARSDSRDLVGIFDDKLHSKTISSELDLRSSNNTNVLDQIIGEPIEVNPQLIDICDRHINLESNTLEFHCDSKDQTFDEIHGKIENSIKLLGKIAISCSGKEYSNKIDQNCTLNNAGNVIRNLIPQSLTVTESTETLMTATILPLSSGMSKMSTIEEVSPVSPVCDNKSSFSIAEDSQHVLPLSKIPSQSTVGVPRYHKCLGQNSTGISTDLSSSICEAPLVENGSTDLTSNKIKNYSHCNGSSTGHKSKDLKCQLNKPKFPSNIIKKMKNKKSYDDIRIEMKRRKSRKKPKLRRENSFDLGDLDLLKVPPAPDILAPFSYSNSETNVKDLITSQQAKSSTPAANNVFINLFDLKDSNEETFV